jgi:hypothetical protein
MTRQRTLTLAGAALVLLIAGLWLTLHRAGERGNLGGGSLFTDLTPALDEVSEVRLSKGDGSRTTLRRGADGWTVVEREYPADASRVRELVMGLANMKVVEHKTSDPANYAKLGVEAADSPTAASTLVEVVAGKKTWSLLVGKNAEGRAVYVRKPAEAASALAEPVVSAEPDPKRWLDRKLTDLNGAVVHDISVQPASGPAYLLSRAQRGNADLALSPVPKGRKPASSMSLNAQGETLIGFNFDDMHPLSATPAAATDHTTIRTFDGQVLEFAGRKQADKAYVTVTASRDAALAAQFPETAAAAAAVAPATPPAAAAPTKAADAAAPATPAKPAADQTAEHLAARANGREFEIPLYKYDSLFRPLEDLLEPKPEPAAKTKAK